ncbi:hypothetical protein V2S66_31620 [Streptomyces sp. V4-01]|uniref:Uncharacterized protein n=1 Tax=Actinacidiphila polyblastidii TaxID=3110430 RepID=A0ABU7PN70_9ACTN|nr:hypothetical protein [Streptomyces sp. V4-01]
MNARKVLELMVRTNRGNMTVWCPSEVRTHIDAYRAEVLAKAGARQLAFAREHWLPAEGDSVSAAAKKERKYGVAEKLVSLIDPSIVLRPRHVRVLPHEEGFLVRWQVGEDSMSTFRKTQAAADAAAAELRKLAGKDTDDARQAPAGESTQAAPVQVWHVYEEDAPQLSAPQLFTSKAAAEQGSIDLFQEMENYCPDYSWQPGEGGSWELLAGGEPVGIYLAPVAVKGDACNAAPDFFRPDRTYTRPSSYGRTASFRVTHISTPPGGGERMAFGWKHLGEYDAWTDYSSDDFAAWTEVGEAR